MFRKSYTEPPIVEGGSQLCDVVPAGVEGWGAGEPKTKKSFE